MSFLKNNYHYFYLALALVGGLWTFYYAILGSTANNGQFSALDLIQSTWTDNNYARSITLDFWTGAVAGTFFVMVEGFRLKIKYTWAYLIMTVFIAFAFAFPLFLFVRARHLQKAEAGV